MYEAVFTVAGDSPYEDATATTNTSIELWCNDHCDLLVVSGDESDRVVNEVQETVGIGQRLDRGDTQTLITEQCLKERIEASIDRFVRRHGCLLIPPLKYIGGEKRARVLALDGDSLAAFYEDIASDFDVQVEAKSAIRSIQPDSPFLSNSAMLPELTDRQREVFETAYSRGYYELPRGTTTAAIADELGIHRRTAETHLRVAERKLVDAFADFL